MRRLRRVSSTIGLAIVNLTRAKPGPEEAILSKASGRLAVVLNAGLQRYRTPARRAVFPARVFDGSRRVSSNGDSACPQFADLAPLLKARLPGDFRIIQGHRCSAGGRQYVHFIVTRGDKLLSLVLTRKRPGESLSGGVYQEGVDRFQVVGFESHDYLVYVISDLDAQQNLQLAASLAPAVREYLAHAG